MNKIRIGEFPRISKKAAEKLYNAGETVRICACNMSPINVYGAYRDMNKDDYTVVYDDGISTTVASNKEFETVVNGFRYYNCNYEAGYYPAFYKRGGM